MAIMNFRSRVFGLAIALSGLPAAAQTAPTHPPVEAFARLPAMNQPALSPDGQHLASIQVANGRPAALIYDLSVPIDSKLPVLIPYSDGIITDVNWANNSRLLITVEMQKSMLGGAINTWARTIAVDADGKNRAQLFSNIDSTAFNYSTSFISDFDLDDPDHIFMPLRTIYARLPGDTSMYVRFDTHLYSVDVNNGKARVSVPGGPNTGNYFMDGHGNVVARLDVENDPLKDTILVRRNDDWVELASFDARDGGGARIAGLSPDGTALIRWHTDDTTGLTGLNALSLTDGHSAPFYADPKYDIDQALTDPWTGRVIGTVTVADLPVYRYFDPVMQNLQRGLETGFGSSTVHAVGWNVEKTKLIIAFDGPRQPRAYFVLDRTTHRAEPFALSYPELDEDVLGEVKPYAYKARDGLEIPAYLTLPPGKAPKNLPVVILPHGGPMGRDDMRFDWESQFLANRGYAVLQPNFRGSSGYGAKFEEAGYGQWGLKMQDDVSDGVKKLIADGIADPKRICIVGGSYGGYAALAGVTFTPDLYACAAAWAPVTDLRQFLATRASDYGRDSRMISSWTRFIGDRNDDAAKLDAVSPARNVEKIRVPVLLVHGKADSTVRIDQSEEMDQALRRAGKKVTFISIEKETHYMETSDTRIRWLTALEKFLKDNIGN
jgi:dipeptidyl aminopeptidase/acylaminoacyl peptidase